MVILEPPRGLTQTVTQTRKRTGSIGRTQWTLHRAESAQSAGKRCSTTLSGAHRIFHAFWLVRDVSAASQRNAFPFSESLLSFTELDVEKVSIALRCISDDLESLDRERVTNAMVKLEQTFAELTPEERYKKRLEQ